MRKTGQAISSKTPKQHGMSMGTIGEKERERDGD